MTKLIITAALVLIIAACGQKRPAEEPQESPARLADGQEPAKMVVLSTDEIDKIVAEVKDLPSLQVEEGEVAVIETGMGRIVFEFYADAAPAHAANFKKLARAGYFDGTTFHRVIPGFMIQGGDILSRDAEPGNDGSGGPGYTIPAEIGKSHLRGTVAAARRGAGNPQKRSSGSQFYICVTDVSHLDGEYSAFGMVVEGLDVIDKIVAVPRDRRDRPLENVVMSRVRVVQRADL